MYENLPKAESRQGIITVLKNKEFYHLWIAQVFSQLADKFFIVLTIYLISNHWIEDYQIQTYNKVQLTTLLATGVYISNGMPAILFGAFAGVICDIWPKLRVLIFSNYLRSVLSMILPICLIKGSIFLSIPFGYWYILIITFFISLSTQFFTPAEQSSIRLLVTEDNLLAANSLYQSTTMAAAIIGFALGDSLIRWMVSMSNLIGFQGGEFMLLPMCYLISSFALKKIHIREEFAPKNKPNLIREILGGIKVLKEVSLVRYAIYQLVILYSLMGILYILAINLSSSLLGLGPTKFGILLACTGLGISLGAIAIPQIGHVFSKKQLASLGMFLIAACLLLLNHFQGLITSTLITCACLGIGASLVAVPAQTIVQEKTPKEQLGKVLGLQNNLINIALSVPLVISGGLISQFGLSPVLYLLAILTLFGAFLQQI